MSPTKPLHACARCSQTYTRKDNLARHVKRAHADPAAGVLYELPVQVTAGDLFVQCDIHPTLPAVVIVWQGEKYTLLAATSQRDGTIGLQLGPRHFIGVPRGTILTVMKEVSE